MVCQGVTFSTHATARMFARSISQKEVEYVLSNGMVIQEYPTDKPFPSKLLLGFINEKPLHVVVAQDDDKKCVVITAYIPDAGIWDVDFKTKTK